MDLKIIGANHIGLPQTTALNISVVRLQYQNPAKLCNAFEFTTAAHFLFLTDFFFPLTFRSLYWYFNLICTKEINYAVLE